MTDLPPAVRLLTVPPEAWDGAVVLDYEGRLVRRKRLVTATGAGFLVDLPSVTNLDDYAGFALADGRAIRIVPAEEEVLVITGDLPRLAWHIGNRHTPCRIEAERLIIRADHVLEAMLRQLGATLVAARLPFAPEGGAYGTGRTMGHDHDRPHDQLAGRSHPHSHHHDPHGSDGRHTHSHE